MEQEGRVSPEEEAGQKGGVAPASVAAPYAVERVGALVWTRDLVRWGPIWAGLLLALAVQLVLGTIGLAVALTAFDPNALNFAERVVGTLSLWSAISALVALFVGGFVAGRMAAASGLRNGVAQGSVVWALAVLIGMMLSAFGVAGLLGATLNIGPLLARGLDIAGPEAAGIFRSAAAGAWWFVLGALVAWVAAAGGGILGTASHREPAQEAS